MSMIQRGVALPIHAPTRPDFYVCHPDYGREIVPLDCQYAVDLNWPKGTTPIHYYFRDPTPSTYKTLPDSQHHGSCTVSIEQAGPSDLYPNYLTFSPNKLRGLAGYVIESCANREHGIGGFVTVDFKNTMNYIESLPNNVAEDIRNASAGKVAHGAFLTISITKADHTELRPGDTEPQVANLLFDYADNLMDLYYDEEPAKSKYFYDMAKYLHSRFLDMTRGGFIPWWAMIDPGSGGSAETVREGELEDTATSKDNLPNADNGKGDGGGGGNNNAGGDNIDNDDKDPGTMTYQCDATLGDPNPTDCEHLSWSGLKSPDAIETLQANHVPNFYSQGTCALGVSSAVATTITWAHLLAAFGTLNNMCVQNPIRAVKGGRAFYGRQSVRSWIHGRKARRMMGERKGRRDAVAGVKGSEALPRGVNATIFRHEGSAGTGLACEWQVAVRGGNVSECDIG